MFLTLQTGFRKMIKSASDQNFSSSFSGPKPPWILKILAKKGCFFNFQIFPLLGPRSKILERPPRSPSGKNPSDAHVHG